MKAKNILITGSTDGIGLLAAQKLMFGGHNVILHGRNSTKLEEQVHLLRNALVDKATGDSPDIYSYVADLSRLEDVEELAEVVKEQIPRLDVLINNAGVYNTPSPRTDDGLDARFAVNTFAPYLLTQRLLPMLGRKGRVVNVSSAAQAPVNAQAMAGQASLSAGAAYAQSKLALTMWSFHLASVLKGKGAAVIAVNPGSLLASKMVKDAFGVDGASLDIGADILIRAALDAEFSSASGRYFDNDVKDFGPPHPDATNPDKCRKLVDQIEEILAEKLA